MVYPITQKYITKNRSYLTFQPKGGVIHETANPGDSDEMEQEYFDSGDRQASAHAFVDFDSITQCVPWNETAWHAGRTANRQFWGVELCHTSDPVKFQEIWNRGVWLYAYLFVKVAYPQILRINTSNLMSHKEVSDAWHETDHKDPVSYFEEHGKTVDDFRAAVQMQIDQMLFEKAVTCSKIISSPDYWLSNCESGKMINGAWLNTVILRFVAMFKTVNTFQEALTALHDMSVISSPDYWLANAVEGKTCQGDFVRILLTNMGREMV